MEKVFSKDNSRVKEYGKLASDRKYRQQKNAFVLEGYKLLEEALRCGILPEEVFVTERFLATKEAVVTKLESLSVPVLLLSGDAEKKLSQSVSPQGVYAVCRKIDRPIDLDAIDKNSRLIALWDLQDPGNVGTIIRTADAMGIDGVLLSESCCDLYNLKTIRAAMGSLFRIPVSVVEMSSFLQSIKGKVTSYAAVLDEKAEVFSGFSEGAVVVIGNEGNGLSESQADHCDKKTMIPMTGNTESMNAAMAATVFLWEMAKLKGRE